MASRCAWSGGLRVARSLFQRPMQQTWRSAHHQSRPASDSANKWLIGAAAGATLIAAYEVQLAMSVYCLLAVSGARYTVAAALPNP